MVSYIFQHYSSDMIKVQDAATTMTKHASQDREMLSKGIIQSLKTPNLTKKKGEGAEGGTPQSKNCKN